MSLYSYSRHIITALFLSLFALMDSATAAPPAASWSRQIIPTGQDRTIVKSTPVELRPNRPMHIYGNTVRRRYYRSAPLPATSASIRAFSTNGSDR